jgi:DNA-binding NtrC family response regulator
LFGHDKGAFTGATAARAGLLEAAEGGTVFLDEVGELSLAIQAKLLRAIESQQITRLGEHRERAIDVRFVAATNRNLDVEVEANRFRRDLYFRLGGAKVFLPPLRERPTEIAMLFRAFLARACERAGRAVPEPTGQVMQRILEHAWTGNVRELLHCCDYLAATVVDDRIEPGDLPTDLLPAPSEPPPLPPSPPSSIEPVPPPVATGDARPIAAEIEDLERRRITEALAQTGGVKSRAAQLIGMPLRTFTMKVKQYKLA